MTDNNKHPKMTLEQAIEFAKTSGGVRFLVTPKQIAEIQKYAKEHNYFIVPDGVFAISIELSSQRPPVDFFYWGWDSMSWRVSKLPEIILDLENNTTNRHPQAELMLQYAKDALETDKPWERWECAWQANNVWSSCVEHPVWNSEFIYRRKLKTININGFEVPEPLKEAPPIGTEYYPIPSVIEYLANARTAICNEIWDNSNFDIKMLQANMIHLTKEAAELHAKALLSFTTLEK